MDKAVIPTHYGEVVGSPTDGADFKAYVDVTSVGSPWNQDKRLRKYVIRIPSGNPR